MRRELRPFYSLLFIVALNWVVAILFSRAAGHSGLVTPSGKVDRAVLLLGALAMVLRLTTLFAVPAIAAYRMVRRLNDARSPG